MSIALTPNLESVIQPRARTITWLALALILAAVYGGSLWTPGLLDDADATHAEAAREMAASGDFVTLKVNGIRYLEKAPLMYWMAAFGYKIFGVNEFSTRLPLFLGVIASALLAMSWGARAFGDRAGGYASVMVATAIGTYLFTRIFIPEVLLSFFIAAALHCFLTALEKSQPWRWYAGYASIALAVLTKGLVALVFVGATAFLFLVLSGEWRRWREFRLGTGLLLFLVIAVPWHILAGLRNQGGANGHGFFWFYFINEHFLRFLGKRFPKDYNKMPIAAYWLSHLIWLFPWSLFLPLAVRDAWRSFRSRTRPQTFAERSRLLLWIYAAVILVFFAFSTNQEYYTFPCYLPLCILVAASLKDEEAATGRRPRSLRWIIPAQIVFSVVGVAIAALLVWGLWSSRDLPFVPDIGTVLAKRAVGNYTLSMSHFFDLTGESFAALRLPAALAAVAFLIGGLTALILRLRKKHFAATISVGITAAVFLIAAHVALERFEPYLSSKKIAQRLDRDFQPGDKVMIYGDQAFGSSLLFYYKRPIYLVNGRSTSMLFGSTFPDVPKIFLDDAALAEAWNGSGRVYLFVPASRMEQARAVIGPDASAVMQLGEKTLYSNRATKIID